MTLNFPKQALFFSPGVYCVTVSTRITSFLYAIWLALSSWAPYGLESAYMFFFWSGGSQASISDAVNTVFYMLTCQENTPMTLSARHGPEQEDTAGVVHGDGN